MARGMKKPIFGRKVTTQTRTRQNSSFEDIQRHAYYMWENEGRPEGKDWEYWFRAEKELCSSTR